MVWTTIAIRALSATGPAPAASPAPRRPSLAVVESNPVVVEGRGFAAREKVTLRTNIAGQEYKQVVTAEPDGHFKARMAETNAECATFRVSAAGERGSRAVTPRPIAPPCGMQIQQ